MLSDDVRSDDIRIAVKVTWNHVKGSRTHCLVAPRVNSVRFRFYMIYKNEGRESVTTRSVKLSSIRPAITASQPPAQQWLFSLGRVVLERGRVVLERGHFDGTRVKGGDRGERDRMSEREGKQQANHPVASELPLGQNYDLRCGQRVYVGVLRYCHGCWTGAKCQVGTRQSFYPE
jgi:hypothetical protein